MSYPELSPSVRSRMSAILDKAGQITIVSIFIKCFGGTFKLTSNYWTDGWWPLDPKDDLPPDDPQIFDGKEFIDFEHAWYLADDALTEEYPGVVWDIDEDDSLIVQRAYAYQYLLSVYFLKANQLDCDVVPSRCWSCFSVLCELVSIKASGFEERAHLHFRDFAYILDYVVKHRSHPDGLGPEIISVIRVMQSALQCIEGKT